jgi:predicted HTH transcriptional regulator
MPFKDPLAEYLVTEYVSSNFNLMFSGESDIVEYKLDLDKKTNNKEFLETVCSFSNSINGGYIFIGMDDNMNCKGIEKYKIKSYKQSIEDSIRSRIDPQPVEFEINERDCNGKKILEVRIYAGKSKPYCIKDAGYYIRVKATDRIPTHDEIISLIS